MAAAIARRFSRIIHTNHRNFSGGILKHEKANNRASSHGNNKVKSKGNHRRPMVHLSSSPREKYNGKHIGTSHPVVPHQITSIREIANDGHVLKPPYAQAKEGSEITMMKMNNQSYEGGITIHDDKSIEKMRKAGNLARRILDMACSIAKPNITTDEIDVAVHDAIVAENAYPSPLNYRGFPKSVCTSVNEVLCHGIPDMRLLQFGDVISIDVSVFLDGVHGDNCATVIVGDESLEENTHIGGSGDNKIDQSCIDRRRNLVTATKKALDDAILTCQNGACISEIGNAIHSVADQYGYRPVKKFTGHGIGTELHMPPAVKHIRNNDNLTLIPGMILTIEPTFVEGHHASVTWEDGWTTCTVDGGLAAQFEHTVLITESNPEILTTKAGIVM